MTARYRITFERVGRNHFDHPRARSRWPITATCWRRPHPRLRARSLILTARLRSEGATCGSCGRATSRLDWTAAWFCHRRSHYDGGAIFRYRPELPPDLPGRERVVPPDDLRDYLRTYVALTDVQYDAVTLWTVHSHCIDAADCTPYLHFTSAGPRSGKTRALEVLELVVDNPWLTGRVTGPALVRKIDAERPTLLLDETDATFSGARSSYEILRGVLNSGYRLNGKTSYAVGGSYKDLATYCPKALAGIGGLPSTIADRSIRIKMERRELEHVQRFRARDAVNEARFVRARLARYAALNLEALAAARPLIPCELDDRARRMSGSRCWRSRIRSGRAGRRGPGSRPCR